MSRVIKFRGYSYEKQSWLYGNLIEKDNPQIKKPTPWIRLIHNRALSAEIVVFESVGQFTGLHDRNGKEIFEGDLIRVDMCECVGHDDEDNEIWEDCEGPVSFEDGMFVFDGHSAGTIPLNAYIENVTVIGNIYQNQP